MVLAQEFQPTVEKVSNFICESVRKSVSADFDHVLCRNIDIKEKCTGRA